MKRNLSLTLAAALLCLILAGCGGAAPAETAVPAQTAAPAETTAVPGPAETENPAETAVPAEAPGDETETPPVTPAPEPDFTLGLNRYPAGMAVMTADGMDISWEQYFTALSQYAESFYLYYGISDYDAVLGDEETIGDWILEEAENELKSTALMYVWADELGLTLSEEELADIDRQIQDRADEHYDGDREALFADVGVPEDFLVFQWKASLLSTKIEEHYFGANGENISDGDAFAYISDEDWLYAKHILYKTVDDAGDPLSEEEIAEKRAQAEAALERLKAADPEALPELFDEIMAEESEDTGLSYYPDGYYFKEGEMVAAFEDAAKSLEEDRFTGIVESDYGFHILYRPPMSAEHIFSVDSSGSQTMRQYAADGLYNNMAEERFEAMTAEYAEDFALPSLMELFFLELED